LKPGRNRTGQKCVWRWPPDRDRQDRNSERVSRSGSCPPLLAPDGLVVGGGLLRLGRVVPGRGRIRGLVAVRLRVVEAAGCWGGRCEEANVGLGRSVGLGRREVGRRVRRGTGSGEGVLVRLVDKLGRRRERENRRSCCQWPRWRLQRLPERGMRWHRGRSPE
jgi:hypothetical protein